MELVKMTAKKASAKAVSAASKLSGEKLAKTTSWERTFEILAEGFSYSVRKLARPDDTVIEMFRELGEKPDLVETFTFSNSEVWNEKEADWDWNFLYKFLTEHLLANRKKLLKPAKKTRKK